MKPQGIQNKQKFSIENLYVLKKKFKLLEPGSFLVYGGEINDVRGQYLRGLYHIMPSNVDPGYIKMNLVDNIKYFANEVSISSCEDAVSFVRLLTAPQLETPMTDHLGHEVLIKEDFTPSDWLGEDLYLPRWHSGRNAVISKKDAERIKVFSAKCTKSDVYKISRFIFKFDEDGFIKTKDGITANLLLLEEEVGRYGQYKIIKKTIHTHNVNSVNWEFFIPY